MIIFPYINYHIYVNAWLAEVGVFGVFGFFGGFSFLLSLLFLGFSRGREGVVVDGNITTTVIDMKISYINELCIMLMLPNILRKI